MSTLIPKHQNKSPIWERYSIKQYVSPTTGIQIIDDAVEKTKQQQSLRSRQRRRGTASKIGAASPGAQKQVIMERQRKLKEAGYYTGKIDGIWGKKSKAAQAAYDKRNQSSSSLTGPQAYRRTAGRPEPKQFVVPETPNHNVYEVITDENGNIETKTRNQTKTERIKDGAYKALDMLLKPFPAERQLLQTYINPPISLEQGNNNVSDSYLENLSQLGQVAYRQYVRKNGYPQPGQIINLPLNPSVYKEINPSGRYADFTDFLGMANAAIGGDRQVEYTDGGMSGKGYIDENGNFIWNATDKTSWSFDPGHEEKLKSQIREGSPGSLLRFVMGKADEQYNTNPVTQNLTVTFPADTISGIARYSTIPKIKQKR